MNNNRNSKIETLKRKSRRKHLINELSYMTLPENAFLDIEENQLFCQKVFAFLQSREHKIQIHGEHYQEHIEKSVQMLKELVSQVKVIPAQARLMFFREREIEALEVNVNEVFFHLNRLLEQTKFLSGYGDFILVAEDFRFGLCIERTEYFYELSIWGL
ncbi:YxiF family protein [Bacillus sp. WC2502]|uniref:YxiF family protein n=1 Tax=Bacillus sp. WC2502 TaxID=3461401 RepID=UPI00404400AD